MLTLIILLAIAISTVPTNIYHVSEPTLSSLANFDSKPLFGGLTDDRK